MRQQRRRLWPAALLVFGVLAVWLVRTGSTGSTYFGTLLTDRARAVTESRAGVKMAMLELDWSAYEPAQGRFSSSYVSGMKSQLAALKAAGMQVTLGLGIHYTPSWVFNLPDSSYVDQHGNTAHQANVVFNQRVRDQLAAYYTQINKDLGMNNFWAIRLNATSSNGEMLYPGSSYYAFDRNAQNGPDLPPSMPRNPFPGWKPGTPGLSSAQVNQWAHWYIAGLDDLTNWQMNVLTGLGFKGWFQTLTPGSGERPDQFRADVAHNLPDGLLGYGGAWDVYYSQLPNKHHVVVDVTSVADKSGNNDSCQPTDDTIALTDPAADNWSAVRWQTRIAHANGMPVAGENPGYSDADPGYYRDTSSTGMLAAALRQTTTCHLQTFYWAHDYRLWDGTLPFSRYASALRGSSRRVP